MNHVLSFDEVLDAADRLPLEAQETLLEVLHRRMVERRRDELAQDIQSARQEYDKGLCSPVSPRDLMKEITS